MRQEEILDYNKRCAEFLGAEFSSNDWRYTFQKELMDTEYTLRKSKRHHQEQMCFHSDWNWIMEVVEAIENIEVQEAIKENANTELNRALGKVLGLPIYTPKKAVVQAINQFLIWYNENNKRTSRIS